MNSNYPQKIDQLDASLLGITKGVVYDKRVTKRLYHAIMEAKLIARYQKDELIYNGKSATLDIDGKINAGVNSGHYVIYHIPFKKDDDNDIKSFDIPTINTDHFDYQVIVNSCIDSIRQVSPNAQIILCTTDAFAEKIRDKSINIIKPRVDSEHPMYYRAKTYNTIIQSKKIKGNIFFLDSDAFLLKDINELPEKLKFKIGLTARYSPNLMPINEGVIMARADDECTRDFFAHYMGVYEEIIKNKRILEIMDNIDLRRWRGGQLSLNAVCQGGSLVDWRDSTKNVKILNCDYYNRKIKNVKEIAQIRAEGRAYIVHLKGKSKETV
ncbi:hypothetical protein OAE68_00220 [Synechococcus sp. AH-551-A10]|nr:hypothetical protein [Synechococcus sp. AH-551-A10]MDB4682085.1 hypothetical protein [Synechococcus sp. AH-551-A10]